MFTPPPVPIVPCCSCSRRICSLKSLCGVENPITASKSSKSGSIGSGHVHQGPMPNISINGTDSSMLSFIVLVAFFFNLSMVPMPVNIPYITFMIMLDVNKKVPMHNIVMIRTNCVKTRLNSQSSLTQKK
jgi:hypothetical protein